MAIIKKGYKDHIRGSYIHLVVNSKQEIIGTINEVFRDVFYARHKDNPHKDTKRYTKIEEALNSFKN